MRHHRFPAFGRRSLLALIALPLLLAGWAVGSRTPEPVLTPTPIVSIAQPTTAVPTPTAAALTTSATPLPVPTATPTPVAEAARPLLLGYYVPYDATSWHSLRANAGNVDYVGAQWVSVDACGNVGSQDNLTLLRFARERGITVLPSLLTGSGWLNNRLLTYPATTQRFLDQIVDYVVEEGYQGFDLDLEGINAEDRDAYSAFVARLAAALHARGKILTLAIPAKTSDVRQGWAGPYDYAALGKHADYILLMSYDFHWQSGTAGSIAPYDWVDKVAAYAASQMPREKVLLGVGFYAYDWNASQGGRARALTYPQVEALAQQQGAEIRQDPVSRSATFTYTGRTSVPRPTLPAVPGIGDHEVKTRARARCDLTPPPTPTPKPDPTPAPVHQREVWLENAASVATKLEIALRHQLGGVGAWRLGQEDPAVWPHVTDYRSGK